MSSRGSTRNSVDPFFFIVTLVGCDNISLEPEVDYHEVKIDAEIASHLGNADIVYFFKYSCPACFRFHGHFSAWRAEFEKHNNINVLSMPVVFNDQDETGARLHFALEILDKGQDYQLALYQAVQSKHDPSGVDWKKVESFVDHRFSVSDIELVMRSKNVNDKIKSARGVAQAVGIRSVPSLFVRGKYRVDSTSISESSRMAHVVETLLQDCLTVGNISGHQCH